MLSQRLKYHASVTVITLYKPFVFQGDLFPTNPASDVRARIAWEGCQLSAFAATDKAGRYAELGPQIASLVDGEPDLIANLANATAAIAACLPIASWVGFL